MMSQAQDNALVGIFGAGGFGREIMPFARQLWLERAELVFVESSSRQDSVNGHRVISIEEFATSKAEKKYFNISVADSKARERLAGELVEAGAHPVSLISPNAIQYDENEIGMGAIICSNVIITSNAKIGKFFHCNLASIVAHDCIIGDYVTFAPAVQCLGNIHIGDHAYIGTGAVIKEGTRGEPRRIGEGAVIGMGAVVTKDVPPYTTVVGNPAKPMNK
jgi:sugar O-acyltransferase (sialic acid O-acetyltransferase NeuD family)